MDLSQYSELEQIDLIEAEKANLLIEVGREIVRILSVAKDARQADALIEQIKRIYFIGYEEEKRRDMKKEIDELVELTKMTFELVSGPGGVTLEMSK